MPVGELTVERFLEATCDPWLDEYFVWAAELCEREMGLMLYF
ncbi:MAG: hypothetical protein AB7N76_29095 [Planctomycetota bacterium]